MTKITIGGKLTITGLPSVALEGLKTSLTLSNPKYWEMARRAKMNPTFARALFGMPKDFTYYKVADDGTVTIPRGMIKRLSTYLDKLGIKYEVKRDVISKKMKV